MNLIKLHLGCGKRYIPGYIHVDLDKHQHIDIYHDIRKLPMFKDNSIKEIYSCGVFEYFDREEAPKILSEWYRLLQEKGIMRISVPDFSSIIKVYQIHKNLEGEGVLGPLFGRIEVNREEGTEIFHHKTVYDFKSLKRILEVTGFRGINIYEPEKVMPKDFDDYSMSYYPYKDKNGIKMHLNLECYK